MAVRDVIDNMSPDVKKAFDELNEKLKKAADTNIIYGIAMIQTSVFIRAMNFPAAASVLMQAGLPSAANSLMETGKELHPLIEKVQNEINHKDVDTEQIVAEADEELTASVNDFLNQVQGKK